MKVDNKENCHWWSKGGATKDGCKLMTSRQCEKNGKCSFYETTIEFQKRQQAFRERHGIIEDI